MSTRMLDMVQEIENLCAADDDGYVSDPVGKLESIEITVQRLRELIQARMYDDLLSESYDD